MSKFNVGDRVRLKGDARGIAMTVNKIGPFTGLGKIAPSGEPIPVVLDENSVECVWHYEGRRQDGVFTVDALESASQKV